MARVRAGEIARRKVIAGDETGRRPARRAPAELMATPVLRKPRRALSDRTPAFVIGKVLLTRGRHGIRRAVVNTQRMLCSSHAMLRERLPMIQGRTRRRSWWMDSLVARAFGSNSSFGLILLTAAPSTSTRVPDACGIGDDGEELMSRADDLFTVPTVRGACAHLRANAALKKPLFAGENVLLRRDACAAVSTPYTNSRRKSSAGHTLVTRRSARPETARRPSSTCEASAERKTSAVQHRGVGCQLVPKPASSKRATRPQHHAGYCAGPTSQAELSTGRVL